MSDRRIEWNEAVLRYVRDVIAADGALAPPELAFLRLVAERLEVPLAQAWDILATVGPAAPLPAGALGDKEKVRLMEVLADAAWSDGVYSPAEKAAVEKVAAALRMRSPAHRAILETGSLSSAGAKVPWVGRRRKSVLMLANVRGSARVYGKQESPGTELVHRGEAEILARCVSQFRGRVEKAFGHFLFVLFGTPDDAAGAALATQAEMNRWRESREVPLALSLRIAIHQAPVVGDIGDMSDSAVSLLWRLLSECDESEIIVSDAIHAALKAVLKPPFVPFGPLVSKGSRKITDIYRWAAPRELTVSSSLSTWVGDGAALRRKEWRSEKKPPPFYRLVGESTSIRQRSVRLGPQLQIMGRARSCDIQLSDRAVHREHAAVLVHWGQCWIFDLAEQETVHVQYPERDVRREAIRRAVVRRAPLVCGTRIQTGPLWWRLEGVTAAGGAAN